MLFLATSKCSWISRCKRYHIQYVKMSGEDMFIVSRDAQSVPFLTLEAAHAWCRKDNVIPETDFATHAEQQR